MRKKQKKSPHSPRRPSIQTDGYFRRNAVVISRSQRETAAHKQSISQRKLDEKRRISKRRRTLTIAGVSLACLVIVGLIRMRIADIRVAPVAPAAFSSSVAVNESVYLQSIEEYIDENIPLRQSWLLDTEALERQLQDKHPEVQSLIVQSRLIHTATVVQIQFRKPAFVLATGENNLFIDKNGVLFTINHYKNVDINRLPAVENMANGVAQTGDRIVTASVAQSVAQLYALLPGVYGDGAVVSTVLLPRSAREVYIKMSTQPYIIKFSVERPVSQQIGELRSLLEYMRSTSTNPAEYIDIRIEGKAFYK